VETYRFHADMSIGWNRLEILWKYTMKHCGNYLMTYLAITRWKYLW
jgi:hypothetical protein